MPCLRGVKDCVGMSDYFPLHRACESNNVWICLIAFLFRIPRQRTPEVYIQGEVFVGGAAGATRGARHVIRG